MLHIIESQLSINAFQELIQSLSSKDAVVLINDGVYLAHQWLATHQQGYILANDAALRGIDTNCNVNKWQPITMLDWVNLTAIHSNSATW